MRRRLFLVGRRWLGVFGLAFFHTLGATADQRSGSSSGKGGTGDVAAKSIASSNFIGVEKPLSEGGLWVTPFASMTPLGVVMTKRNGAMASRAVGPGHNHAGARIAAAVPNDHYSEIVVGRVVAGSKVGPVVRCQPSGPSMDSHYVWWVSPRGDANNYLYRVDANGSSYTSSALLGVSGAVNDDRLRLIARGPLIYGVKNGVREFIYNTGQDPIMYSAGTTGIVVFPSVANGVRSATIASWSTGAVSSSSATSDFSAFVGTESPLDENDRWYPVSGANPGAGFIKRGGLARGTIPGIHNLEGSWGVSLPNDQFSQVTLGDVTSGGGGPMVRVNRNASGQSGYLLFIFKDAPAMSGIYRNEAAINSFTNLSPFTPTIVEGDVWKLTAVGSTLTAFRNGVRVAQVTDATYTSGDAGIEAFGDVFGFSAWSSGPAP
jgi:hypothetical protein